VGALNRTLQGWWGMRHALVLLGMGLMPLALAQIDPPSGDLTLPAPQAAPVDLERELLAPWQAGGEIVVFPAADGRPLAGRRASAPRDAEEERARRLEHFALAYKLNLVTVPGTGPSIALPLAPEQVALLARFALSDAGAVWFREMAEDSLGLFNKGYLAYDTQLWEARQRTGMPVRLSDLLSGGLSEAGLFAQDASLFRIYAHDGMGPWPPTLASGWAGRGCAVTSP